jgi:hypothetical protein
MSSSKKNKEDPKEDREEDFLSVDTPIPGQNFTCLSFVSPEKELANKEVFLMHNFLKDKAKDYGLSEDEVVEKYKDYLYNNRTRLEKVFYEREDFQTTVRGVKVRGIYDTYREAQVRAKLLQKKDKNFHVYVGQVGYWLPWDPNADEIQDQEYSESQLNKLVKKYQENSKKRDTFFENQKEESLKKIKQDNKSNQPEKPETSVPNGLDEMDPWMKRKMENTNNEVTNATSHVKATKVTQPTSNEDNSSVFDLDT